jgi:hypothetical protein
MRFLLGVWPSLPPLGEPPRHASDGEQYGQQLHQEAQDLEDEVEVNIRVELVSASWSRRWPVRARRGIGGVVLGRHSDLRPPAVRLEQQNHTLSLAGGMVARC